jgi:hypothetical protein
MDESVAQPLISLTLTQEELDLVGRLLDVEGIPGLDVDGSDDPQQSDRVALGLLYAERSLRARELARIDNDGRLLLHEAVLATVSVCAYAEESVFVFHTEPGGTTSQYLGHRMEDTIVAHVVSEAGLHYLAILPDREALVEQVLSFCNLEDIPEAAGEGLRVSSAELAEAREKAAAGDVGGAAEALGRDGSDGRPAETVAHALAGPHEVSILVRASAVHEEQGPKFTILRVPEAAWCAVRDGDETSGADLLLQPIGSVALRKKLEDMLAAMAPTA